MKLTAVKTAKKSRAFNGLASQSKSDHDARVQRLGRDFRKLTAVKIAKNTRRINVLTAWGGC